MAVEEPSVESSPPTDPVVAAAKAARDGDIMAAFDAMIDSATDDPARDLPPALAPTAPVIAPLIPEPKKEIPRAADDFHKDPLIQKALEIFAAKIVTA
jgi:hypothetical protein